MIPKAVPLSEIPNGCNYFMGEYPGNVYRKLGSHSAEFVVNRHSSAYNGCKLTVGPQMQVYTHPHDSAIWALLEDNTSPALWSLLDDSDPLDLLADEEPNQQHPLLRDASSILDG